MSRLHLIKFILFSFCVFVFSAPLVLAAQTITIDTKFLTPDTNATSVPEFIARFYELGLGIAGIVAVGMIVVGAIFYTISGASPQKKGEAKDIIFSALWGVVLLFGSYLILRSINPQLIDLRDPGSGLGGNLPSPIETGNCASSTPAVDVSGNPTGGNIPPCGEGDSPIDPATGFCRCFKEVTEESKVCPEVYQPVSFPPPYPKYNWYSDQTSAVLDHTAPTYATGKNGQIVCPKKVTLDGNRFYTIDCDSCEDGFEGINSTDDWYYEDDSGNPKDTTGWMWPYYPKKQSGAHAICLLYAHYDPEDKEIERTDLDGLAPCRTFSSSTVPVTGHELKYPGNISTPSLYIQNPDPQVKNLATQLAGSGIVLSSNADCGGDTHAQGVLNYVKNGYYPMVCSPSCNCQAGGTNHTTTLSSSLLNGLKYMQNNSPRSFRLESLTGGKHDINSDHYKGKGADVILTQGVLAQDWQILRDFISGLSEVREAMCEYETGSGTSYTSNCNGILSGTNRHIHISFK